MATLCLNFSVNGQEVKSKNYQFSTLKIGDKLPEELWRYPFSTRNTNGQTQSSSLQSYRGRLIILDFWATWCSACIANFYKGEQIQNSFPENVKVLAVSTESDEKIYSFFNKSKSINKNWTSLHTVTQDTILNYAFTHRLIPHYVWIKPDGTVLAFTSPDDLTIEKVRMALSERKSDFTIKADQDLTKPLFASDNIPLAKLSNYSLLLKGSLVGTGSTTLVSKVDGRLNSFLYTNTSLLLLYNSCFAGIDSNFVEQQIKVRVKDSSSIIREKSSLTTKEWYRKNGYSYNLVLPEMDSRSMFKIMLNDLNKTSGYQGQIIKRRQKCYVLTSKNRHQNFKYIGGEREQFSNSTMIRLNKIPIRTLMEYLNSKYLFEYPVVNETHYNGDVKFEMYGKIRDIKDLKKQLSVNGLHLKASYRIINEFSITDSPSNN